MYDEDAVDYVVADALTPGPGAQAIGAFTRSLLDQYAERRFMRRYYEAKAQGPVQWLLDENGQHVLDGNGTPMWIPAPNPMVVAGQDAMEWRWKVHQLARTIGGLLAIPIIILCIYWTF